MTMELDVHNALLRGDLPARYRQDAAFRATLDKIQRRAQEVEAQPRIYGNFLVRIATGEPPSPEVLNNLAEIACGRYIDDAKYAVRVDNAIGGKVAWGDTLPRKYLNASRTASVRILPSLTRTAKLGTLCRAIQRRCGKVERAKCQRPIPGSCRELGYSGFAIKRLGQHARKERSNYLMNLFEAIRKVEYPGEYGFESFVLYHISDQALVANWPRILQEWGEFSHTATGLSTDSRRRFSDEDYAEFLEYSQTRISLIQNVAGYFAHRPDHAQANNELQVEASGEMDSLEEECQEAEANLDERQGQSKRLQKSREGGRLARCKEIPRFDPRCSCLQSPSLTRTARFMNLFDSIGTQETPSGPGVFSKLARHLRANAWPAGIVSRHCRSEIVGNLGGKRP